VDVWLWRVVGVLLLAISAYGFLNGFIFRVHGPAFDLGIVAGVLGAAALWAAQRMKRQYDKES
jgi:hypothetical protein